MNEKTKETLLKVKLHIQAKQYQEALDECQVLIMKNDKIFNAQMFAGFCYEKLGQDAKAEKAYLYAEDLDPKNIDIAKALYGLYSRLKKDSSTKYLQKLVDHYKKTDKTKYIEYFKKLIKTYEEATDLQLINKILDDLKSTEKEIHEDFMCVAEAYFRVAVQNECFQVQVITQIGENRIVGAQCKQQLDRLLLDIMKFLKKVSKDYQLKPEEMSGTIAYLRQCFPQSGVILYLSLIDGYMISHFESMEFLLNEIHLLLSAFYEKQQTPYTNLNILNPEVFTVSMLLTYEYLRFIRQFFTVNQMTQNFISKLQTQQQNLLQQPISQQNRRIVKDFILRQAVEIANAIQSPEASTKLLFFRDVAKKHGGFLEQVLARLAMNVFKNYKQLNDMKNILKIRITNEPENVFLLKYYYDYLIKIGRVFKVFDQEISIKTILEDIIRLDPCDLKYQIQEAWISFSSLVHDNIQEGILQILTKLQKIQEQGKFEPHERAILKKKILIIKVHLNKSPNTQKQLQQIIKLNPLNYHSLLSLGSLLIQQNRDAEALNHLKKAFVVYQRDYHLNRYIYLCFMKLGDVKQAQYFTERIYAGFPSVFWTNYVYANASMNRRNYDLAETYLTKSIEIFVSNREREYLVSYEKVYQRQSLASPYLILQNKYKILDESLIIPQQLTDKICPLISSFYYKRSNLALKEIRMWLQTGQTLKILGRLASSLKSLKDANQMCQKLISDDLSQEQAFMIVLVKKQLATVEFYYSNFKDAEQLLSQALSLHTKFKLQNRKNIEAEIYGLYFQISIQKLLNVMRTESYQTIQSYIKSFKIPQSNYQSISYLKCLYQLRILCYLHNQSNSEECLKTVSNFLAIFGLNFTKINTKQFSNVYYALSNDNKKLVSQAIQDLVIFCYISKRIHKHQVFKFQQQELLSLLQLIPDSPILYILYGVMVKNIKSKVGAFLKCVQLDPQNPTSLYFLANLYLRDGRFLPAIQLYLKGIQTNPLDMKSYYGLVLCLLNMAIKGINSKQERLVTQCLQKVHSFLEYIKIVNPTLQYNFIDFLKMMFFSKNLTALEKKVKIQNGLKAYEQLKKLDRVVKHSLLDELSKDTSGQNIWKFQGRERLVENFIKKYVSGNQISPNLTIILNKKIEQLQQLTKQKIHTKSSADYLNDLLDLVLSLALKSQFKAQSAQRILNIISTVKEFAQNSDDFQRKSLSIKRSFFRWLVKGDISVNQNLLSRLQQILPNAEIFDEILNQALKTGQQNYKKKLNRLILSHPQNEFLRQRLQSILLLKNRQPLSKVTGHQKERFYNEANCPQTKSHGYQKLMFYYNDPTAWVLFIKQNLHKNLTKNRLGYWLKLLLGNPILLDHQHLMHDQTLHLFVEIYVKYEQKYGADEKSYTHIKNNPVAGVIYQRLKAEFKLYKQLTSKNLTQSIKLSIDPTRVILNTLHQTITKFEINKQIIDVFKRIDGTIEDQNLSKYFTLLYYLCALNAQKNQSLTPFERLQVLNDSSQKIQHLDPSRIFILINKSQLDMQPQKMDQLLGQLSSFALQSNEEKKLACYFDLMYVYNKIQAHPEDEDIFQSFQAYVGHTQELGDLVLNSFLHYLNGLVALKTGHGSGLLTAQDLSIRQFKRSILLNPSNGRVILSRIN